MVEKEKKSANTLGIFAPKNGYFAGANMQWFLPKLYNNFSLHEGLTLYGLEMASKILIPRNYKFTKLQWDNKKQYYGEEDLNLRNCFVRFAVGQFTMPCFVLGNGQCDNKLQ